MAYLVIGSCTLASAAGSITTGNQWNPTNYTSAYLQVWLGSTWKASSSVYNPPPGGTGYTTGTMTASGDFSAAGTYTVKAFLDGAEIDSATFMVPSTPTSVDATQPTVGNKTVSVTWSGLTTGATYTISARVGGSGPFYYKASTTGASASFTVDNFATYEIAVRAAIDGRDSPSYGSDTVNVVDLPTLATPTISSSVTQTSISITLGAVTGADTYYARIGGGSWQSGSGRSFSFTGLSPGTAYTIDYKCSGAGYYDSATGSTSITTATNNRPSNWSWSASNGAASAAQTQAAYSAVSKAAGYSLENFSYLVWNDLVDKVDAFCAYKNKTAVNPGAKMSSGARQLSADRFNFLLTALHQMASTGIAQQSPDDWVYGSYFTTITTSINNIT